MNLNFTEYVMLAGIVVLILCADFLSHVAANWLARML